MQLPQKGLPPGARSSHAVAMVGDMAYVFGGELQPRVPVDNHLHAFHLHHHTWSLAPVAAGYPPPPRVGVTMAALGPALYLFGGRDAARNELPDLYSYDTATSTWSLLPAGPPPRSYHSMAADPARRTLYVFGGCGVSGRLNDLWAFDAAEERWTRLPDAPCRGRGGAGLAVAGGKVWVVYGFAGEEMDDVYCFDPAAGAWAAVEGTGERPSARSVFAAAVVGGEEIVVYGGEVEESSEGHMGAGRFDGEVYGLETGKGVWRRWEEEGKEHPGRRGWCAFAGGKVGAAEGLLVYGGNSPSNERLDDLFFFSPHP